MVTHKKTEIYGGRVYKWAATKTTYAAAKTEAAIFRAAGYGAIVKNVAKNQYAVYVRHD